MGWSGSKKPYSYSPLRHSWLCDACLLHFKVPFLFIVIIFSPQNPLRLLVLISSFTPPFSAGLLYHLLSFICSSLISMTAGCSFTRIHTLRWVHSEVPVSTLSHRHTVFFRSDLAMNPERPTPCYGLGFKNSLSYYGRSQLRWGSHVLFPDLLM